MDAPKVEIPKELADKVARGELTLGELIGLSKASLYAIAQMGHEMAQTSPERAAAVFKGLVAASPYDAVFQGHLAAAYYALERHEEALVCFEKAVELNPTYVDALAGCGELYLRQGEVQKAVDHLARAVHLDSGKKRPSALRAQATLSLLKKRLDEKASKKP